jgi:hypothetical protein
MDLELSKAHGVCDPCPMLRAAPFNRELVLVCIGEKVMRLPRSY